MYKLCAALIAATTIGSAIAKGDCPAMKKYLTARAEFGATPSTPEQQQAFGKQWLPVLIAATDDKACGRGLNGPTWHAMTLANGVENWTLAAELAVKGLADASQPAERALWRMNLAGIAFNARDASRPETVRAAVEHIDAFLAQCRDLISEAKGDSAAAWGVPALNALTNKAVCLRELGDPLGAAAVEQQAALTSFAAAVGGPIVRGSFRRRLWRELRSTSSAQDGSARRSRTWAPSTC